MFELTTLSLSNRCGSKLRATCPTVPSKSVSSAKTPPDGSWSITKASGWEKLAGSIRSPTL